MFHASIDIVEPKSIIAFQLRLPPEAISRTAMSARPALQKASSRYWAKYTLQASPFFSRNATAFGIFLNALISGYPASPSLVLHDVVLPSG